MLQGDSPDSIGKTSHSLSFLQGQLLPQGAPGLAPCQMDAPRSSPGGHFHIQDRLLVTAWLPRDPLLCSEANPTLLGHLKRRL